MERTEQSPSLSYRKAIKSLDVFPKIKDDVKIQTSFSGFVTLICFFLSVYLILSELWTFSHPRIISSVTVDTSEPGEKLKVNFNIILPAMPCDDFGLDMVDMAGDQQLEITEHIQKIPHKLKGCQIQGTLETFKVRGEFHIAFGRKAEAANALSHIHRFSPAEIKKFNSSHTITRLSFGEDFPGVIQPLDGVTKTVEAGLGRYQYFVQIVPTVYEYASGTILKTNQYSITENTHFAFPELTGSFKQPGIFFRYEISPYTVNYKETHKSLAHLITSISAIIGGIFVVSGFISSFVWYTERMIKGKK
eukprot:TRINITY_DN264_c0_g1_i1.p1 TRINITY_DN264_c0_g1~~TRINITY_DN264_c0_g1_i1.p1  ORF type:complete len:305 (-),score=60.00 TRINITY_DN264_c0_g1_i1:3-917(-)